MPGPGDKYLYWHPPTKEMPIGVGIPKPDNTSPVASDLETLRPGGVDPTDDADLTSLLAEEQQQFNDSLQYPDIAEVDEQMEAAARQNIAEQTEQYIQNTGITGFGPGPEQYDYNAMIGDGHMPKPNGEGDVDLPNAYWKPESYGIAGFDVVTGERFTNQYHDEEGFIRGGIDGIRNSTSNTHKGPPTEDILPLANIAYGIQLEGGSMEDYKRALGAYHSDENIQRAWNAVERVRMREALDDTFWNHGEELSEALKAIPDPELPESITYGELAGHEVFMKSARVLWQELEGMNPVTQGLEGEYFADPEERPPLPDDELVDWALTTMSNFNWNIPYMSYLMTRAINGDDNFKVALYNTMSMYDSLDTRAGDFPRALGYMLADPLTYVSLGAGRFAAMAAKVPAKKVLLRLAVGGGGAGAFEGGVFMGVDDSIRQTVEMEAGRADPEAGLRTERDIGQTAMMTGIGAVGGLTLGTAGATLLTKEGRGLLRNAGRQIAENAKSVRHVVPGSPMAQTGAVGDLAKGRAKKRADAARIKMEQGDKINDLDIAAMMDMAHDKVNAPVPYKATVDHVRTTLNREQGIGAPKYEGKFLEDEQGRIEFGLPTVGHWLDRVNEMLSPQEINDAMNWYSEVPKRFEEEFGAEGEKVMIAWLMSNQNVSPVQALMNAFRVKEQVASGAEGLQGGLSDELVRSFLSGKAPQKGMDLKLHDFIDSALGKQWRTVGGNIPEMGMPAVIDVHSARDMGYIDAPYRNYLVERFGKEAVEAIGINTERGWKGEGAVEFGNEVWNKKKEKWEASGGVSATQYEYAANHLRQLTNELNEMGFMGGNLTPAQVQAIGWTAQARRTGSEAFDAVASIRHNTRQLSYDLAPAARTQLAARFGERFGALPYNEKGRVTRKVNDLATAYALQIVRPHESVRFYGPGGYKDAPPMPTTGSQVVSSKEAAEDMADIVGYLLDQSEVLVTKAEPLASGWKIGLDIISPKLKTPARLDKFWQRLRELEPKLEKMGFHQMKEAGAEGIRIIWPTGGKKSLEKLQNELAPKIDEVARELGIETATKATKVTVSRHGNDYEANPKGGEYLARIKSRYGSRVSRTLEREHRRNVARLFDEELGKAEERIAAKQAKKEGKLPSSRERIRVAPISREFAEMAGLRTGGRGKSVQVFKNPTTRELKNSQIKEFRHMRDTAGNIYAWDANEAIHDQVSEVLERQGAKFSRLEMASDVIEPPEGVAQYWKEYGKK